MRNLTEATRLDPQNVQFLTAREVLKAKLVFGHIERGNVLLLEDARARAAAEFRAALDLDAENEFARERLQEATREVMPTSTRTLASRLTESTEIHLEPDGQPGHVPFQRGRSRIAHPTGFRVWNRGAI